MNLNCLFFPVLITSGFFFLSKSYVSKYTHMHAHQEEEEKWKYNRQLNESIIINAQKPLKLMQLLLDLHLCFDLVGSWSQLLETLPLPNVRTIDIHFL